MYDFHDTDPNTVWNKIEWKNFFVSWQKQESNIIKLTTKLKEIYLPDYAIIDR
ncbi:14683_t:CDS:2, partial [Dentiscutata heterogama]